MKLTDKQKVLNLLREAGSDGIHSFTLNTLVGTIRSVARICDLKHDGYHITAKPERLGDAVGVRYFLNEYQSPKMPLKEQEQYVFIGSKMVRIEEPKQEVLL